MLKAARWAFVGVGGQQVMRLVVVLVLARLLTPEEFGVLAIAQMILSFAEMLRQMGLGSALVQTGRLSKKMERGAASAVLVTSLAICTAIYLLLGDLARPFQTPEPPAIMPVLFAGFMLIAFNGRLIMPLNRAMRFRELAIAQLATYIVGYGAVAVGLALLDFSYWVLIWATLVQTGALFLRGPLAAPGMADPSPRLERPEGAVQLRRRHGAGAIFNNLTRRGDNMIVAAPLGTAQLGYYSRAYSLMDVTNQQFETVFYKVLFPAFSEQRRRGGTVEARATKFVVAQFIPAGGRSTMVWAAMSPLKWARR